MTAIHVRADELERVFPQPEGPGKGAFAAIHPETAIGGVFNRIRIEHMDREGVDAQVLYGSMTLSFEALLDPELAVACMRAYNDYIADDCRAWGSRGCSRSDTSRWPTSTRR